VPRKGILTKGGLERALQKLVQKGEWDKARVERFRARVRDHVRGDHKAKTAAELEKEKPKGGKSAAKRAE